MMIHHNDPYWKFQTTIMLKKYEKSYGIYNKRLQYNCLQQFCTWLEINKTKNKI